MVFEVLNIGVALVLLKCFYVLKKLVRRKLMYHSYSMQFHGYISSPSSGRGSFTLAHGVCSVSV